MKRQTLTTQQMRQLKTDKAKKALLESAPAVVEPTPVVEPAPVEEVVVEKKPATKKKSPAKKKSKRTSKVKKNAGNEEGI
jgi:hypothetical protein